MAHPDLVTLSIIGCVHRQAVVADAKPLPDAQRRGRSVVRLDRVADAPDGAVGEQGIEAAGMRRAELIVSILAGQVLLRGLDPPYDLVSVPTRRIALVVIGLRCAELVGAHAFLTDQDSVRAAVGDVRQPNEPAAQAFPARAPDDESVVAVAEGCLVLIGRIIKGVLGSARVAAI